MNELETYKNIHDELLDLFHVIVKWGTRFQVERNLDFIIPDEIIEIKSLLLIASRTTKFLDFLKFSFFLGHFVI